MAAALLAPEGTSERGTGDYTNRLNIASRTISVIERLGAERDSSFNPRSLPQRPRQLCPLKALSALPDSAAFARAAA